MRLKIIDCKKKYGTVKKKLKLKILFLDEIFTEFLINISWNLLHDSITVEIGFVLGAVSDSISAHVPVSSTCNPDKSVNRILALFSLLLLKGSIACLETVHKDVK